MCSHAERGNKDKQTKSPETLHRIAMHYLLGCDEAGYGPNLGPLVISLTAWQLPDSLSAEADLYQVLSEVITPKIERTANPAERRLAIADSKKLYQSRGEYRYLEEAVWVALHALEKQPSCWRDLWTALTTGEEAEFIAEPWHTDYDGSIPLDADPARIESHEQRFASVQQRSGVRLLAARSDCVFPLRFNRICQQLGSKGMLLSTCTLRLVADMIAELPPGDVTVLADKHGGRNRYGELLQAAFNDHWVEIRRESRAESSYRICNGERTIDISFRVGGEAAVPTAWASLFSKYLREMAMRAFNHYWQARVNNLRPTAGYPVDARRFMAEIEQALTAEDLPPESIWRMK